MIEDYQKFVLKTTSNPSRYINEFSHTTKNLEGVNSPLLITASIGMSSEVGEFNEIVKKILFQGKPMDDETHYHMVRELGDVCWYVANAANALGVSLEQVINENIRKLKSRYPDGFEVSKSENRKAGDI